ncbi:MAG: 1-aminocyclopropane-1-carboxylate deaminase/D-cysteine desulfhydrase [Sphingomonadales bacterium]
MSTDMWQWFAKLKSRSRLEHFYLSHANNNQVKLFVKRDDLIHPFISGNKIRKLEGNMYAAKNAGALQLLTFGGAYSNHLLASAAAAKELNIPILGWIRGDELNAKSNTILHQCHQLGMKLNFINRSDFKESKYESGLYPLQDKPTWFIPEGGANPEGILGCTEIYKEAVTQNNNLHFDAVFIAQGTTTTSLGLLASIPATTQLFVVPVLKGFDAISEMQALAQKAKQNPTTAHLEFPFSQVRVLDTHHHGGYAKTTPELMDFIKTFNDTQQFPIEPTYTAKSLLALQSQLPHLQSQSILFIHTGGVQTFSKDELL